MPHPRLIIFARYPLPGRAKTRLIPALGEAEAARLQDVMTRHTLEQASALAARRRVDVEVRFTGASAAAMRERYGGDFAYACQGEGDLGARLCRAAAAAAADCRGGPVVIIGTDCPGLTAEVLRQAFDALSHSDVVLGPALDGGYYLLGLRRFTPELFQAIPWGTPQVLALTRRAAERSGRSCAMLRPLQDVDVAEDLDSCGKLLSRQPAPYRPERLAITGATGSLGRHFLAHVLRELPEVRVTALVRRSAGTAWPPVFCRLLERDERRIELVEVDLRRSVRLTAGQRRAVAEADGGLWHFAACTALHAASPAEERMILDVNEGGTARLLDLLTAGDRPGPLYHLSTAYVCGRRADMAYEHELDAAAGFRNGYERAKHAAEARVRAALAGGLGGVIFRPGLVMSDAPGGGAGDLLAVLAAGLRAADMNGRRLTLRVPPQAGVNAVPVEWVTPALLSLAPLWRARRTYHLTARQDVTIPDFAAAAGRCGDVEVRLRPSRDTAGLSAADRLTDRMLRPFRPYFDAQTCFDRRNLELDAPALVLLR